MYLPSSKTRQLPIEGEVHQQSHNNFYLFSTLLERYARAMKVQKLLGWPSHDWSKMRSIPHEGHHAQHCLDDQVLADGYTRHIKQKNINEMMPNDIILYS